MLSKALHMTPAQVRAMMNQQLPAMTALLGNLPTMQRDFTQLVGLMDKNTGIFAQVPAGLKHYEPLVRTMQANVTNFKEVNSLPDFRLFTWFFVVPGALLVLLAAGGLGAFGALRHIRLHPHRAAPTH